MWRFIQFATLAGIISTLSVASAFSDEIAWHTDVEAAFQQARETNRPILMHFWSPDSIPCQRLEKNVMTQPRVVQTLQNQFVPIKINAQENPKLASRYHINSVPKDVILNARDEELARMFTPQDAEQYVAQLSALALRGGETRKRSSETVSTPVATSSSTARTKPAESEAESVAIADAAQNATSEAEAESSQTSDYFSEIKKRETSGVSQTSASYEEEPREVINRFAKQNLVKTKENATPGNATLEANENSTLLDTPSKAVPSDKERVTRTPSGRPRAEQVLKATDSAETVSSNPVRDNGLSNAKESIGVGPSTDSSAKSIPANSTQQTLSRPNHPPLGLDGYCPVTLITKESWKKGDTRYGVVHRGRTYLFTGPQEKEAFFANPDEFSPVLAGFDPVELSERGEITEGLRAHGVVYRNRVYLFANEENLNAFWESPERYTEQVRQAMKSPDFNKTRR